MVDVHVLRVFTDARQRFGNPLGVVLNAASWPPTARQRLATRLGYSETVFVDDATTASLQLFTPASELPFAGHPLVGVSALLADVTGRQPDALLPLLLHEPVPTRAEDGTTWIRGSVADAPPWDHERLADPAEVDALLPPPLTGGSTSARWRRTQCWAWLDHSAGVVRARVFAADYGVVEDEACGSASLLLAARLGRPLTVRHGQGSVIQARPVDRDQVEIGGRVVHDGLRRVDDRELHEYEKIHNGDER
ncbi:PhzF family phenazine biosynthesis protein [Streptantibioticus rubrisoli]|uniref:PhzF family phenazine biosynthesis protein n=1 Tax=Streptantibioticus rubrisoli TaxID=1387313 RepID=A0ABT1PIS5_9ACTN|nr:PhzF family phenazine biosynthesis protein [Streptantibioticus rubrisoli]MCQ4045257.1 PhzF family phenazine biosynthesis protein [Streptantibioticus rubrisoli]